MLKQRRHDTEERNLVRRLALRNVAVFGNGNNDGLLLHAVKQSGGLAIAVDNGEGYALDALLHANVFVVGVVNALSLLLQPQTCRVTLRF